MPQKKNLIREVPDWDTYFLSMLDYISSRSKDPNTQVGCIIVDTFSNSILSTGYNSLPRNVNDKVEERLDRKKDKYLWMEHAERNAIYNAARHGIRLDGATIYQPWIPCIECARAIVQSGIWCVKYDDRDENPWKSRKKNNEKDWNEDTSRIMLCEGGVDLCPIKF